MGDNSRYGEFAQSRTAPVMRGKKVRGSQEDDGKFWKCRCGFINNIRIRPESDRVVFSGTEAVPFDDIYATEGVMQEGGTSVVSNNTGMAFWERHSLGMDYHVGCAFCGRSRYR